MKRPVHKAVILTVGVVIVLIAGCSEQDASKSEVRKSRLIATQLKKQSEQLGKEVEEQKELLAKCLQEKKASEEQLQKSGDQTIERLNAQVKQLEEELEALKGSKRFKEWEKEIQKSIKDLSENAIRDLEEITKLREENEKLKTEIMELKKELEMHKGPTPLPHTD